MPYQIHHPQPSSSPSSSSSRPPHRHIPAPGRGPVLARAWRPLRFVFGALLAAGLSSSLPAAAADPVATGTTFADRTIRLHEVAVHRYVPATDGTMLERRYLLDALNRLTHVEDVRVPTAVVIPDAACDKVLILGPAWTAYQQLGPNAVANFELTSDLPYLIADRTQYEIRAHPEARLDQGKLGNISTRGSATASDKLIAGFVVTEQHRRVLLRAVGPALAPFGVPDAMPDPFLTLYKGRTPLYFNGNWATRPDADAIAQAAAATGAFPLPQGSKDAALLVELEPGAYTVQVEPETGAGGVVLVEVYVVP